MNPVLQTKLRMLAARRSRLRRWSAVAACWAAAAFVGLGLLVVEKRTGWYSRASFPAVAVLGLGATVFVLRKIRHRTDLKSVALEIESAHPELDGRLLTALENGMAPKVGEGYFHQRLLQEVLNHDRVRDWGASVPKSRIRVAQLAHWLALLLLAMVLTALWIRPPAKMRLVRSYAPGINVTPGDTTLEKGSSLVVVARFGGRVPNPVQLFIGPATGTNPPTPMVKSLADPMFGVTVPEVSSNLVYSIQYGDLRTRDYTVTVFEFPKLERADAELHFPEYTGQGEKRIENSKRISAVEGTRLDLQLQFNKPVASAELVAKGKEPGVIPLTLSTNKASARLADFTLLLSKTYALRLLDAEGRTNKVPAELVFNVLTNRSPELRLASPRGDMRPSPLQEIRFEGTVWDDFGVPAYGLGYTVAGGEPVWIELGKNVPAKEKRTFQYLLKLEDLDVKPDTLVAWFAWAEDLGPDGKARRTTGDLFFGEVRPFDEIFREGQGMEGGQGQGEQQQQGQQQSPGTRVTELQKQIINATWRLQREQGIRNSPSRPKQEGTEASGTSSLWPRVARPANLVFGAPQSRDSRTAQRDRSIRVAEAQTSLPDDAGVVRDSQAEVLRQAREALDRQQDPRAATLWRTAIEDMEKALERLKQAEKSPEQLKDALAAEQAAYQTLLKLQEHEYQVTRSRRQNRSQSGQNSRQDQMQQQLEQMDLTQSEDRYETQRQAARPQNDQRREELQILNRLQELARRQQDLNERLKELQSALQEARTQQEREELQRQLKRLQEEQQQMLADTDELRDRMDRPENQSRLAEQRQKLEQAREDMQRAAQAAAQGSAAQAAASGTRAQNQLQEMRDEMRKENSSQFSEEMRSLRNDARELARQQQEIMDKMNTRTADEPKSLSDSGQRSGLLDQLTRQNSRMTNLVDRATQVSQDAEQSEALLSRQLYDSIRKFSQDSSQDVRQLQEQWLSRGTMTRSLMDRFREQSVPDGSKLLDATSEMLRMDLQPQAREAGDRARRNFDNLRQGVERAAESVLGDDTEALRLARQEIEELTKELEREMARAMGQGTNSQAGAGAGQASGGTNAVAAAGLGTNDLAGVGGGTNGLARAGLNTNELAAASTRGNRGTNDSQPGPGQGPMSRDGQPGQNDGQQTASGNPQGGRGSQRNPSDSNRGQPQDQGQPSELAQNSQRDPGQGGARRPGGRDRAGSRLGSTSGGGADGGDISGSLRRAMDLLSDSTIDRQAGPITGDDFGPWSDRLRDVEEMIDIPDLRNEVARARERARQVRQAYRQERTKPDWAVVRLQVMSPLVQVRDLIAEELARRESREALVPIDRDPVPTRYSDLVRRYYEELGKER